MNQPLRVLFVEDSESDLLLMVRILKKTGYTVDYLQVETGCEMEDALLNGHWDLIISDYHLPGFNGSDALKTAQMLQPDIPFIAVSGDFGEEICADMIRAGADDCLVKSTLYPLLASRVNRLLDAAAPPEPGYLDMHAFDACRELFEAHEFPDYVARVMFSTYDSMQEMEAMYYCADLDGVRDTAHRLRSPCGNIGARALARVLAELEQAGAEGQQDQIPDLLADAWYKYSEFLHFLQMQEIELQMP